MEKIEILRPGSASSRVWLLQLGLTRAGRSPGKLDGIFGPKTYSALIAFQKSSGLIPDGAAGPKTFSALRPYLTGYAVHTVARGDTFFRLAQKYGTSAAAIETANPGVFAENLQIGSALTVPLGFPVVSDKVPHTPEYLEICIIGLKARYPFLGVSEVGKSVLGRPLYALSVGTGAREVFYNAAHHANEWITSLLLMTFIEKYCAAYVSGAEPSGFDVRALFGESTLYLMPMVNPDGVALVTGEISSGAAFASAAAISADYPSVPFPRGWKANIAGTDLNLQYPAGWEEAKRLKFEAGWVSPAPRDFVGFSPLSAPESRAVYNFTRAHSFALTLSYHTQGGVIYWQYNGKAPEESAALAAEFARLSGYAASDTPLYSGFAGYKDWFIDTYSRPGFTVEAGRGESPLPLSQFPEIYRDNEGILLRALKT